MYKCKYFKPHELVPPEFARQFADEDMIYGIFDENALRILDMIREWAGVPLTINNWFTGGARKESGFRVKNSTTGAAMSAHKLGKGFDVISTKITPQQLWQLIDKNADKLPCKIRIEKTSAGKTITWLHFDTNASAVQKDKVYYFNA